MKRIKQAVWMGGMVVALAAAAVLPQVTLAAGGPPTGRGNRGGQGMGQAVGGQAAGYVVTGTLDEDEVAVLGEFLLDEHKALATYQSVMEQFGEVEPFALIAQAEERHIVALERIFTRYGVALPTVPDFDVPAFASVEAAAAAGVQAETNNAALYDALLSEIDNADVIRVAEHLRDASLNNHLSALQSVVDGTYEPGDHVGTPVGRGSRGASMQGQGTRGMGTRGLGTGECVVTDTIQE